MIDPVAWQPDGILLPQDGSAEPERLAQHVARYGPPPAASPATIGLIEASGLRGRGGAAFPAAPSGGRFGIAPEVAASSSSTGSRPIPPAARTACS